jgi:hypothetical protein
MKKTEKVTTEDTLVEINKALWRHSSLSFVFIHGIVRGLGTALGATVLVAIVTSLTLRFADVAHLDAIVKAITHTALE